jgi:hypothetical protein
MERVFAGMLAAVVLAATNDGPARDWTFDVAADGIPVGTYTFMLREDGATRQLVADAKYRVRLLVVNAYSYEHHDEETWQGDCLVRLAAHTLEQGRTTTVDGHAEGDAFVIEGPHGREMLPACPMTFAYWNPRILQQKALINTQTGALTPVSVKALGHDRITVRGVFVDATRYRMETERTITDVWYSSDDQWLGLRATTRVGGHTLTYRLR